MGSTVALLRDVALESLPSHASEICGRLRLRQHVGMVGLDWTSVAEESSDTLRRCVCHEQGRLRAEVGT